MLIKKTLSLLLLASLTSALAAAEQTPTEAQPTSTTPATKEEPQETPPVYSAPHLKNLPPAYSDVSRQLGEKGRVVVLALVSKEGLLQDAKIVESSGFPRLDVQAIDTVTAWRFEPATKDGKPVVGTVRIPLEFSPTAVQQVVPAAPQVGDPAPLPELDSTVQCSKNLPKVDKWATLITQAPPPPKIYPKPMRDRAVEISKWDPHFEFDTGRSPYLAFELPAYNQPYKINLISTTYPNMFYPMLVFLDRKFQPTRCLVKALNKYQPADWGKYPRYVGDVKVERNNRKDRYLLIYTTPELTEKSVEDKNGYNVAGVITDWLLELANFSGSGDIPKIKHSYYGMLTIRTAPLPEAKPGSDAKPAAVAAATPEKK